VENAGDRGQSSASVEQGIVFMNDEAEQRRSACSEPQHVQKVRVIIISKGPCQAVSPDSPN
jgi:hypothetical protein